MNSKRYARFLGLLSVVAAVAVVVAPGAQARKPASGYEQFAGCPTVAEAPSVSSCIRAEVKSGHLKLGNKDTPITNPIVITGGVNEELGEFQANAEGGLHPAREKVPGGLVGLTGLEYLTELLGVEALNLYATAEAAGSPVFEGANNVTLPLKVHLENAALGNNCYVGTESNPVVLHLTTGTSGALTGELGEVTFDPSSEILTIANTKYVDGTFPAPGATGCKLLGLPLLNINKIIDIASGLPAASGTNETEQIADTEVAEVGLVYP
jgi:hypothetical protein